MLFLSYKKYCKKTGEHDMDWTIKYNIEVITSFLLSESIFSWISSSLPVNSSTFFVLKKITLHVINLVKIQVQSLQNQCFRGGYKEIPSLQVML